MEPNPTSQSVADAISALNDALNNTYGCDYAYTIVGNGQIIAASNNTYGVILPVSDAR